MPADVSSAGLRERAGGGLLRAGMHLRLSDQELATLVEMVSLAANVASWNQKEGSNERVGAFEDLESKILEKAGHSGLGDWIEFDEESQRFRVKSEVEERLFYHECYDEFRNESFWDELAVRLADRDLARAIGFEAWEKWRRRSAANARRRGRSGIGRSSPNTGWNGWWW